MRKVLYVLLAVLTVMAMFVSCDSNSNLAEDQNDLVNVSMVISEDKNLTSQVNKTIMYWEFMARPDFQLAAGENVYGIVSYWKTLPAIDTAAEPAGLKLQTELGLYTSGSWLFEVRGLNSYRQVVAIGSTRQIVRKGLDNTLNVTVYTDRADGTHGESMDETSRVAGATSITAPAGVVVSTAANYGTSTTSTGLTTTRYGSVKLGAIVNRLDASVSNTRIRVYSQKVTKDGRVLASQVYDPTNPAANATTGLVDGTLNGVTEITGITWTTVAEGQSITLWSDARNSALHPNSALAAAPVGQAKVYYECTIPNIDAGPYIYTFVVEGKAAVATSDITGPVAAGGWVILGGQAVDVLVIGGETTYVTGTLLANDYVLAGLKITAPGAIVGSINNANYVRGNVETGVDLEYHCDTDNSAEAPSKCYWYVNGDLLKTTGGIPVTSTSIHFDCPQDSSIRQYGIYRISCSPTGELGSIGNETIDVIFNPPTGPNVGEFDWASLGLD